MPGDRTGGQLKAAEVLWRIARAQAELRQRQPLCQATPADFGAYPRGLQQSVGSYGLRRAAGHRG